MTNPGPTYFSAAMRVVIYLRSIVERALTFRLNEAMEFDAFVDLNWSTRFSASGALFFFHVCLVLWFSEMQRSFTLSNSAEAIFFCAMLACKEMIFFAVMRSIHALISLLSIHLAPVSSCATLSQHAMCCEMEFGLRNRDGGAFWWAVARA
jgi:hypothetical protein